MPSSLFGPPMQRAATSQSQELTSRLEAAKQTMGFLKTMRNPQVGVQSLLDQNQNIKSLIQSGADLRTVFYSMAQQRGVDPESILGPLREMMK